MKMFAITTPPPRPNFGLAQKIAWIYAVLLIVMLIGQLFEFEKFIPLIESFGITGGHGGATLLAALIVVSEVFALPYLLGMYVSPLMRYMSVVAGVLVGVLWLYVSVAVNAMQNAVENIGFFGTKVDFPADWWAVVFALITLAVSVWLAWGLGVMRRSLNQDKK